MANRHPGQEKLQVLALVQNFGTFDQALNSIKDWLSKNPGYNIRFHKEVLFVQE